MNEESQSRKLIWSLLAIAVLASFVARLASLNLPLDRDEGEYATLAMSWLQGHGIPYRDYLEQKPPLAVLLYALPQWLGFFSVTALRVTVLCWQGLATGVFFFLALKISREAWTAFLASMLYAFLSAGARSQGISANTELFVALPMLGAFWLLPRWLWVGALLGVASLFKQSALPAALVLPLLLAEGNWKARAKAALKTCAGAAAPWVLCILFFALAGAAGDFLHCLVTYNLAYASLGAKNSTSHLLGALGWIAGEQGLLWICLPYAAWRAWRGGDRRYDLGLAWMLAAMLGISMGGHYYPHYFQIALAPLSLIFAQAFFESGVRWRKILGWVVLGIGILQFIACNAPVWTAPDAAQKTLRIYGVEAFATAAQAADWINAQTPEQGRLWIWGSEAEAYFLSRRLPATRFLFNYPFTGEAPAWPDGDKQLRDGLLDPQTEAVLLSEPLPSRELTQVLLENYSLRTDVAPPFMIGLRKH